jgi:TonB family protein
MRTFGRAQGARLEAKYTELQTGSLEGLTARAERAAKSDISSVGASVYHNTGCAQVAELQAISAEMVRPTRIYRASIRSDAHDNPTDFLGNFVYVHGGFRYFDQQVMQALSIAKPTRISLGENVPAAQACGGITSPVYPKEAREQHIQGTVVLHVVVGTDGTIKEIEPVSGHPLLVPAAIDAVKRWRYKPTKLNGKVVEVDTQINVVFSLQQ